MPTTTTTEFRTAAGGHYEATEVTTRRRNMPPQSVWTLREFEDTRVHEFGELPEEGKAFTLVYGMPALQEQLYALELLSGGQDTHIHVSSPVTWVPQYEEFDEDV